MKNNIDARPADNAAATEALVEGMNILGKRYMLVRERLLLQHKGGDSPFPEYFPTFCDIAWRALELVSLICPAFLYATKKRPFSRSRLRWPR